MAAMTGRDFASLLDDMLADDRLAETAEVKTSLDYLSAMEELHSGRIHIAEDVVREEYRASDFAPARDVSDRQSAARRIVAPSIDPSLPSTDPADIARELAIAGNASAAELDRLRRDFAFRNHPDRVEESLRGRAIVRMQIANMLIDQAKRANG